MENFFWGTATSSYQIEGGVSEGGRGWSVWDAFCRIPGRVRDMSNGDIACDSYHRFPKDVAMMKQLGVNAYRFSIAWPRIQPTGRGEANPDGIAYYNRLIDLLLENGITPFITLYHWDLPLDLEMAHDGWLNPQITDDFAAYAELCFKAFGDRVKHWITLNEPWCVSVLGYGSGGFPPGRTGDTEPYIVAHHLLLAHGKAVRRFREGGYGGSIGICLCWADFKAVVIDSWIPNPQQQIAMFHTLFNVFTTALLIPFSRSLVKLSQFVIREKKSPDEFSVKYIDERILQTPAIALAQLIKEMSYMLEVAQRALDKAMDNFINRTEDEEPVRKDLREINFLSGKVTDYLIRLSEEDMSHNDELTVSSLYKVLGDIMRVADFSNNIMRYLRVAVANELYFSSEGLNEIKEMYSLVDELFKDVDYTFANRTTRLLAKIEDTESKTDKFKLQLQQNHLDRLKGGNCKSESSSLYVNLIGNIERVADHLVYIAQSVKE